MPPSVAVPMEEMNMTDSEPSRHAGKVNGSGGKVSSEANNKFADEDDAPPPPPGPPSTPPPLYTPPDTYSKVLATGVTKAGLSWSKTFILGMMAGVYLSFGGALGFSVGGNLPGLLETNPGIQNLLLGLVGLPTGLFMIVITGAELFTANTMFMTVAVLEGKASPLALVKSWTMSWLGNLAGSLMLAALFDGSGVYEDLMTPKSLAFNKAHAPWGETFVRGILCNWLVCLAIWMATATTTLTGKFIAVLLPISAFVAIGLEHCVANMFSAPLGIMLDSRASTGEYIYMNLIPVTIGNAVAGVLFMAVGYCLVFGRFSWLLKY